MTGKQFLALYPNLRQHRSELGLSIQELLSKVDHPPSEKSVRRLESGKPIRATSAYKLFNAIYVANGKRPDFKRENEIKLV